MLSSLPKLTDKNFVIAFFLPALLAFLAVAQIFPDASWSMALLSQVTSGEKALPIVAVMALAVWVLAVLLLTANYGIYRMIEGYLWPLSSVRFLQQKQERLFTSLRDEYDRLQDEWTNAGELSPDKQKRNKELSLIFVSRFPSKLAEVKPTRFGNAIRAFEVYPPEIYGADSIGVWLRLASVISKEFQALVDDARAQVDFFLNTSVLSLLVAAVALTCLLVKFVSSALAVSWSHSSWFAFWRAFVANGCCRLAIIMILGIVICRATYNFAVLRVPAWGDLVKTAFDCYLPALATQLGYPLPSTDTDRKAFWSDFSAMILYSQPMELDRWIPPKIPSGDDNKGSNGGNPFIALVRKILPP